MPKQKYRYNIYSIRDGHSYYEYRTLDEVLCDHDSCFTVKTATSDVSKVVSVTFYGKPLQRSQKDKIRRAYLKK